MFSTPGFSSRRLAQENAGAKQMQQGSSESFFGDRIIVSSGARTAMSGGLPLRARSADDWLENCSAPGAERSVTPVDQTDLNGLYRARAAGLRRYVARRIDCTEDALDFVQEAFARLLGTGARRTAEMSHPEAYLQRVARNLLLDRKKTDVRRAASLHIVVDDEQISGPDPHRLLESRDMLRRLEAAMLRLKPRTREIFLAHRLDGLSYAEIADRTGLSVKGVEKQMSKAIAQIDRVRDR